MKSIVIAGTSGVGKTFLEEELESFGFSYQLPKYTNRSSRPDENSTKTVCITSFEFESLQTGNAFFFTLNYGGYKYGWKRSDLLLHQNIPITLAITLESLADFLSQNLNFTSVLLTISVADLSLIEKRLRTREKLTLLSKDKQLEIKSKISQRIDLARQEITHITDYEKLVISHDGLVFSIKDDRTIFDEVIPKIKRLSNNNKLPKKI